MVKYVFIFLSLHFVGVAHCIADDSSTVKPAVFHSAGSHVDFEKHVRDVAEQTVIAEKARKEQARLAAQKDAQAGIRAPFNVFKYKKNGTVIFSDSVPYNTPYQLIVYNSCYACSVHSKIDWYNTKLHLNEFAETITQAAKLYSVDPALIRAVIHAESAFNPLARSRKGAMGLMQLMPGTASDMGVKDSTDPRQNINGGVKYLAMLLQNFKGDEVLAAAAYNAGPKAVARHNGIPPYEETQAYVKRVTILMKRYKSRIVLANN